MNGEIRATSFELRTINYGPLFSTSAPMNRGTSAGGEQEGCASRFIVVRVEFPCPFMLSLSKHPLAFIHEL